MFFLSIGLPSRFGEWCDAVTALLVRRALGEVEPVNANTLEEFSAVIMKARAPYVVLGSRQTLGRLWAALKESERALIVAFDDPRLAIENLVVRGGFDFLEATRITARSCASILSCAALPGALVLGAAAAADPLATAMAIARHFDLAIAPEEVAEIVRALEDAHFYPFCPAGKSWWESLDEQQRVLAGGATVPFSARFAGGELRPITWERDFFYMDEDRPGGQRQPASRPADVTGRPRIVIYGPYLTLPPGSWSATIALGFSPEAAELSYLVEVYSDRALAQTRIQPGQQRVVEVNLNFAIDEPTMMEFRIANERAAFDGKLALGHVIVSPHTDIRPETREFFADALT